MNDFIQHFCIYDDLPTELRCRIFIDRFYVIYDQCCPTRKKVYPQKQIKNTWIDHDLITLCKRKNNLYNLCRQGVVCYNIFISFRN